MYSGHGGSPSRALSTMSLSVRPIRRLTPRPISRSQSFTGFNISDNPRNSSMFNSQGLRRKPSRASRLFTMSPALPKAPQPERLDDVYEALKKGLLSYLQMHHTDLDCLGRQIKQSKRNSRLGFLYELDKQVKVVERFIRRLDFHLSKIEELYEAYCLQRRLRDGADKMVKAYTASASSKEAKESLVEANKGFKEYTENMCMLENQLESQLGEFHIKMKGLAGFARLCAGDQYEIWMKYGRQQWKLKGRVEINAKQVWDSEDTVFLPLINEFLHVKVTEQKSLANHVVVGSVCCETTDFYAALPQTVAVDVNDLGTIKLSLEVTWNPFDKNEHVTMASTVTKPPTVSKRLSTIFNNSPPDSPSLREQAFYNMLRLHEELENGTVCSNSSESSNDTSCPELSAGGPQNLVYDKVPVMPPVLQQEKTECSPVQSDSAVSTPRTSHKQSIVSAAPPKTDDHKQYTSEEERDPVTKDTKVLGETAQQKMQPLGETLDCTQIHNNASSTTSRFLSRISSSGSLDDIMSTEKSAHEHDEELPQVSTEEPCFFSMNSSLSPTHKQGEKECVNEETKTSVVASSNPQSQTCAQTKTVTNFAVESEPQLMSTELEEALGALVSSLEDYRGQFPQLQLLEQELKQIQVTLQGHKQSRSASVVSLSVEMALCSFDFLNTSDGEEEEEGRGERQIRNKRSMQDPGCNSHSLPTSPLTTGNHSLDHCLVEHLKSCNSLLLRVGVFGPLRCGEIYALDRLLREARILKIIQQIAMENPRFTQVTEVMPQLDQCRGALSLWQECVDQSNIFYAHAETFVVALEKIYSTKLPARMVHMASTVFLFFVEKVIHQRLPQRCSNKDKIMVTIFQLWNYVEANGIRDMDAHIAELADEAWLAQSLASPDQEVIVQILRHPPDCTLRGKGLDAVAKLLNNPVGKVASSASSLLLSLASQPRHRERALVSCLELLEDKDVNTRICGCKALACLKGKETIEQLVYICQTDKEEVRVAAKQALLQLGEEGKMAHRHVETSQDSIPRVFAPGSMASTAF